MCNKDGMKKGRIVRIKKYKGINQEMAEQRKDEIK